MQRAKVFYSYSHRDESYRKQLETNLSILRRNGYIHEWHDRRIAAGRDWEEEINLNLEDSDIILLLVSSYFLESDYCYDTETIRALEKHENKESVVIPIIVRPCLWLESKLSKLQALPRDNKAISTWSNKDKAWVTVAQGILDTIRKLKARSASEPSPVPRAKGVTKAMPPTDIILKFLREFSTWYFSPLRIQKWGGRQRGFEVLSSLTTKEMGVDLPLRLESMS